MRTRRASYAAVLISLAVTALASDATSTPHPVAWKHSELGDTLVVPLDSAPFPHHSRADGHTYNDVHYPADVHYADNSVAVFIPAGFDPSGPTDLLFYFHGWNNTVASALEDFNLREMLVASGRNAVLVFPQGPSNAPDSSGGRLEEAGAFKAICDDVLGLLVEHGRIERAELGEVYLSGHSGAYRVIARGLEHGGIDEHITRVYLLDASYALLDRFASWVAANPDTDRRLYSVFTEHLGGDNVELMLRLQRLGVAYGLHEDTDANEDPELLRRHRAVFLYTTTLDHNEAVSWLEPWLRAR